MLKHRYTKTGDNQNNLVKIESFLSVECNASINFFTVNARSLLNEATDDRNIVCETKCAFGVVAVT